MSKRRKSTATNLARTIKTVEALTELDSVQFVRCPECGNEQADMGRGVQCEECGFGPMPAKAPR